MSSTNFRKWVKEHEAIIIAGTTAALVLTGILVLRNTTLPKKIILHNKANFSETATKIIENNGTKAEEALTETISRNREINKASQVKAFIRKLPDTWHASETKIATGPENGFDLSGNTTWVQKHTRNRGC